MIQYRINGVKLVLFPESGADMEERHPIVSEDLTDAFTQAEELPVRGNEAVLGHVHELRLEGRTIRIENVELWSRGVFRRRGVFYVEGSTEGPDGSVFVSFSADGFISGLAGKRLREVDFGPDIQRPTVLELLTEAAARNEEGWPEARYCYPMIYNPDAYGSNNPDWHVDIPLYDPATSYAVNDLIRYTKDEPVRRERAYICIGAAPAGENPDNTPGDWEPYGQGIVNAWSPSGGFHPQNSALIGNRCAMSPQFYLKDILTRAMADQGLTAVGDFMDDITTHQVIVYNNQMLDEGEREDYVLASFTAPVTLTGAEDDLYFNPDDETTPPNIDTNSLYAGGYFVPATTGAHTVRGRVKATLDYNDRIRVRIWHVATNTIIAQYVSGNPGDYYINWDFTFALTIPLTAGDQYAVTVSRPGGCTITYQTDSYLEWWRGSGNLINTYTTAIHPAAHVPDVTIEHLLLDVRDWFHVRITPIPEEGIVRFDYQEDILDQPVGRDITPEVRSRVALDHAGRTTGIRLLNPTGRVEDLPDLSGHTDIGSFDSEGSLPTPASDLQTAYVRNTGQLMVSRLFNTNQYAWFSLGTLCRDTEVGDMTNPREVAPEFGAPDMDLIPSPDGSLCLMPVIKEACSSGMFGMGNNPPGLYFLTYMGMRPNGVGDQLTIGGSPGVPGVAGVYGTVEVFGVGSIWTLPGGTVFADSVYFEYALGFFVITSGGTYAEGPEHVIYYASDIYGPWYSYTTGGGGGVDPAPITVSIVLGSGLTYPLATPFSRTQGGDLSIWRSILFDAEDSASTYNGHWKRWAALLAQAEVYVADIDMSRLQEHGRGIPLERFLLHNQVVLFDTLPTRHSDTPGPPIAEEVRLLRLPTA